MIAVFGTALQATTLRPLLGRDPLTTILATFGISLVLPEVRAVAVGTVGRDPASRSPASSSCSTSSTLVPGPTAALAAAIIVGLYLFLKHGKYGIWIRATTQDRVMAAGHGHPRALGPHGVFAIGAAMAAASGVLFGPLGGVTQTMGVDFTLRAFIVVVVGGMGNLGGSILAAIFISLLEAYASLVSARPRPSSSRSWR